MRFVRHRALLALALSTGLVAIGSPARAENENTAPTAAYALDSTAIWPGQHVRLTESGFADDATPSESVVRRIAWGDGATETSTAGSVGWQHTYTDPGTYEVIVTLNDGQLDGAGAFSGGSSVTVSPAGGSFTWREPTVYTYPDYQAAGVLLTSGVPANASRVWTDWVDGETTLLGKGPATLQHWYPTGSWTPKITLQNAQGKATAASAATLTVAEDSTPPWVTLNVPAAPARASSWTTISGQAGDDASGPDVVGVALLRSTSTTEYYYDFAARRWVEYNGGDLPYSAQGLAGVDPTGSWRISTSGMAKGYTLDVWYTAWDKVGNSTEPGHSSYYLSS